MMLCTDCTGIQSVLPCYPGLGSEYRTETETTESPAGFASLTQSMMLLPKDGE